uniref:ATP synthase gamma subunit n=1 Tax=Carsonella ruddii TaxID=114186 RepID=Q93UB0_CARRU|nr:ATP synthase gamma subunit [Candidatus Carsonella ruddii]
MNIRDIKYKINVLFNINKLTNTMSMISFSKMNKFHKKFIILKYLYLETKKIINEVYLLNLNYKKNCCILITTNKGFCGSINNESIKYCLKFLKNNKNLDIIIIGKKSIDFFKKKNINIKKKIFFNEKNEIEFDNITLNFLKNYNNIFFISNKIIKNQIKTIKTNLFEKNKKNFYEKNINYKKLFKKYLNDSLNYLFNENYFCELKLRMITMKSASDNSNKIIKSMKILKNKIRQFKVTQDMLEIINGNCI